MSATVMAFDSSAFPPHVVLRLALADCGIARGAWASMARHTEPGMDYFVIFLPSEAYSSYCFGREQNGSNTLTNRVGGVIKKSGQAEMVLGVL